MGPASLLVVDRDGASREALVVRLAGWGHEVFAQPGPEAVLEGTVHPDLVLLEEGSAGSAGPAAVCHALLARNPGPAVLLLTSGDAAAAHRRALELGAAEWLDRDAPDAELSLALARCLERVEATSARVTLETQVARLSHLIGLQERALAFVAHPDLEVIQERVLSELTRLSDAGSAALWLAHERGWLRLRAYRGGIDRSALAERFEADTTLLEQLRHGAPWFHPGTAETMLLVPLCTPGEVLGFVRLSDPLGGRFGVEHLEPARLIAAAGAAGIQNARRFLSLQRLSLRDPDSVAYNLAYFTDYATKEMDKARRYGRSFSLLLFSIDNLAQIRARAGAEEAHQAARAVIRVFGRVLRESDVLAKVSEHEFYLLLPETDGFGATVFARRALAAVRDAPEVREMEAKLPLSLVGGSGTYPRDGEDFDELVQRCRRRMDARRGSLQRTLLLDALDFWEAVELLVGSAQSARLPLEDGAEPSRRGNVSEGLFEALQGEVARELAREPTSRGLVYIGTPDVRADLPIARGLERMPTPLAARVYVLGRRADLQSHPFLTPVFLEGDERLGRHAFLLWLGESSSYALLQRPGRGAVWGFHTSDTAVVDGLVSKLQATYDLQPY